MSEPGTIQIIFEENSDAEVFFPPGDLWSDVFYQDLRKMRPKTLFLRSGNS